jgi:hypothetical protein
MRVPIEIFLEIFKHLSPVTPTCLGITCKALYGIHWSLHGRVQLEERSDPDAGIGSVHNTLGFLLRDRLDWMKPLVLEWCDGEAKFVPMEHLGLRRWQSF